MEVEARVGVARGEVLGLGVPVAVGSGVSVGFGPAGRVAVTTGVDKGETGPVGVPVLAAADGARVGVDKGETAVGVRLSATGVIGREGLCIPHPRMNTANTVATQRKKRLNHFLQTRKH